MKTILLLAVVLILAACSSPSVSEDPVIYDNSDLEIIDAAIEPQYWYYNVALPAPPPATNRQLALVWAWADWPITPGSVCERTYQNGNIDVGCCNDGWLDQLPLESWKSIIVSDHSDHCE